MATLFVCGDIVNSFSEKQFIGPKLCKIIQDADYAVGNLEGAVTGSLENPRRTKVFQHPKTLAFLQNAGFDLLLLANNHITDQGKEGLIRTQEEIRKRSMDMIGAGCSFDEAYAPVIREIGGIRFGMVNLCEAQPGYYARPEQPYGYAWLGHPAVPDMIRELGQQCDRLLIFVHAGLEHYVIPLAEYRELYRRFCDLGADCVIAAHPHVSQGIERYNDSLICYSLGNFFFPHSLKDDKSDIHSHSLSLLLSIDKDGDIRYRPIFHALDGLQVEESREDDSCVDLTHLNGLLLPERYRSEVRKVYLQAFDKLCYGLYSESLMGTDEKDSLRDTLKKVGKYLFFRNKYYRKTRSYREKLLYRLITNETYRFLAEHALLLKDDREKSH